MIKWRDKHHKVERQLSFLKTRSLDLGASQGSSNEPSSNLNPAGVFRLLDETYSRRPLELQQSSFGAPPNAQPRNHGEGRHSESERRAPAEHSAASSAPWRNQMETQMVTTGGEPLFYTRASSPASEADELSSTATAGAASTTDDRVTPMGSTTRLVTENANRSYGSSKVSGRWVSGLNTALAILSLAVGLGNIVRLPRVAYLNGGVPFLLVYAIVTLILGVPLVFLEIGLGQFSEEGTTKIWRALPLFKGVGYVKVFLSTLTALYYPILMTLSLFYTIWSGKGPLPFAECNRDEYNFEASIPPAPGQLCLEKTFLVPFSVDSMWLGMNIAFLFLIWAVIMLCIFRDKQSYRSAVYFTLTLIVVCLLAVLIKALTLDPTLNGLGIVAGHYDWSILGDIKVWYLAIVQMFFSTQVGFGNIVTCAGRLYSKNHPLWTAILYILANLLLGGLAVLAWYTWLGAGAQVTGINLTQIPIPEAWLYTALYDAASRALLEPTTERYWVMAAFAAVTAAGFATMISLLYTLVVAVSMEINSKWQWWHVAGAICAIGFALGIPCLLPHNLEIVHILDHYVIGRMIIISTILELIGFAWIYGCNKLYDNFEFILGRKLNPFWKIMWIITPVILIIVEIWSLVELPLTGMNPQRADPLWVYTFGWILYFSSWVIVILTAICQIAMQDDYGFLQKLKSTLKPSRNWGPADPIYYHNWSQFRSHFQQTGKRDYTLKRQGTRDYTHTIRNKGTLGGTNGFYHQRPAMKTIDHASSAASSTTSSLGIRGNQPPFLVDPSTTEHVCWRGNNVAAA